MKLIDGVVTKLEEYLSGRLSDEELDDYTLGIIGGDEFDKLDESIADLIYQIDNRELNGLSRDDLGEVLEKLKKLSL